MFNFYRQALLSILHSELVSIEGAERDLHLRRDELSDWKKNFNDLEAETQKLIHEMRDLQRNTEEERTLQNEQNPTYFSPSLATGKALLHNFYLAWLLYLFDLYSLEILLPFKSWKPGEININQNGNLKVPLSTFSFI